MELQAPGGKRMNAQAFIQGHHLKTGDIFSSE
jgi:methionyl-tRNA formyltransferase